MVVAKPGSGHVRRRHERVGLLQILQHALPAATAGQQVSQVPKDPFAETAAGFGVGTATAWRYINETVALLAGRAPKLRGALRDARPPDTPTS